MRSVQATLLDAFELRQATRPQLLSLELPIEWFERGDELELSHVALVVESRETPPWTPEPVDRRWRARGWGDE